MLKLKSNNLFRKLLVLVCVIVMGNEIIAQSSTIYIYGTITDQSSGEPVAGASVYLKSQSAATITNAYGFYSLKVMPGSYTIVFQHVSFQMYEQAVIVTKPQRLDVSLIPSVGLLKEIVVKSEDKKDMVNSPQMSRIDLKPEKIKQVPTVIGEPDLLKVIQLLPGVNVANEGSSNLNVRGGGFDQNLILLDEAPVYNPSHALGFFSIFNADALRSVSFYKGAFPAQYGGRLSSVVDVYMKEGNNKERSVEGGIGLIASRITYQQPIKKNKSSFLLSGRYSYAGQVVNGLGDFGANILHIGGLNNFVDKNDIYFYDFNAKLNFVLSAKDKIYISGYTGRDKFYSYQVDNSNSLRWGNITSSARWNRLFSSHLFANTSFILSKYDYSYFSLIDVKSFLWKAAIISYGLKSDYDLSLSRANKIKMGLSIYRNLYRPGSIEQSDTVSVIRSFSLQAKHSLETAVYLQDEMVLGRRLSVQAGLRATIFLNTGPGRVYTYNTDYSQVLDSSDYKSGSIINNYKSVEPRLSLRYLLTDASSLKIGYTRTTQFQHLVSNSSVGLPTDVWIPADSYFKPQRADQLAVGYFRNIGHRVIELSVEAYYKVLYDIIDYKENADLFLNQKLETQILPGKGRSYGVEFLADKKTGRLTGWMAYTWSNTSFKIQGVNNNNWFPARYDIRHNFVVTGTYTLNNRLSFAATFKLTSGGHITVPEGNFSYSGRSFLFYSTRNGYTLPVYHRLDVAATLKSRKYPVQKIKKEWVFGIFNVYNRTNAYSVFLQADDTWTNAAKAVKFYLYGIVPSVSLNFSLK